MSRQIVPGQFSADTGTEYSHPYGGGSLNAIFDGTGVIACAGRFSNLVIRLNFSPGSSNSWTFTVQKNGTDTGITVTISDSETVGIDSTNTITVAEGDTITLKTVSSGSPPTRIVYWYMIFDSTTAGQSFMCAAETGNLSTTVTQYLALTGVGTSSLSTDINEAEIVISTPGTFKLLYALLNTAPGGGASRTFTLMKNGAATILGATLSGSSETSDSDTTDTVSVVAGDVIAIRSTMSAFAPNAARVQIGICFEADTARLYMLPMANKNQPGLTGIYYATITDRLSSWTTAPGPRRKKMRGGMIFTNIYANLSVAPGSGKSRQFLLQGGTSLNCTISDTATAANGSTDITIVEAANFSIKTVPTSSPTASVGMAVTFTVKMQPVVSIDPLMLAGVM